MTRPARDGCWHCQDSLRHIHGLHGYFCRRVQDYRKEGCSEKKVVGNSKAATVSKWLVSSKKTGVVCHASTTREGAERWSKRFLGEHGEVTAA